jgi:NADP-dependent 3-hydroxy acid dehydrogenase YdfG
MNTVKDKIILVTGGGQGLGAAICKTLAEGGATLISVDVNQEGIIKVAEGIKQMGGKAHAYIMDVCNQKEIDQVVNKIIRDYGKLDILINNAGIDVTKSIEALSVEEWNKVIGVNLNGPFNVSKTVYPWLVKNGKGHIVNIVSTASKRTWANASAYHASKWGLLGLSHALHVEGRKDNIKVTAVVAGGMRTPFIMERFPDTDPAILQDPKNVAETIQFILSQPDGTVIPEIMVIPTKETSWP